MSGADDLDQASDLTQLMNESAIAHFQKLARPEQVCNPDGTWPHPECVDCGNDIPAKRLEMGRSRCIECQTALEHQRRGL